MHKILFSHDSDQWATPKKIYDYFMKNGYSDPCPLDQDPKIDGLLVEWGYKSFVNPPYSDIMRWVDKSIREYSQGKNIVLLVPSRTDTIWFHKLLKLDPVIHFIKGRLSFNNYGSAPFPSVLIYLTSKKAPY